MSKAPSRYQWHAAVLPVSAGLCGIALMALAAWVYSPWLASVRGVALWGGFAIGLVLLLAVVRLDTQRRPTLAAAALLSLGLATLATADASFRSRKAQAFWAPPTDVANVGRHIIAGYRDATVLKRLIERGAVGGVFVTARNARHLSADQLAAEIASFQAVARANGHPPLVIATDQEGGFVSRLSPPLARPGLLAEIAARPGDAAQRAAAVRAEAATVAASLRRSGITMNFAPLADLDFGIRNPKDRMSRIGERAISTDPAVVAAVAKTYCDALFENGVMCTLKHFPGLGRIAADTHVESAVLPTPLIELNGQDWQPFREVTRASKAAVMIGHVRLDAVDNTQPASLSPAVVSGVLRGDWAFDGVVVTDDLNMSATSDLPGGVGAAALKALNAGADLILISYDPDQVYPALSALLAAQKSGTLDPAKLARSKARLDRK